MISNQIRNAVLCSSEPCKFVYWAIHQLLCSLCQSSFTQWWVSVTWTFQLSSDVL